jgi:rubrerythrin
MKLNTASAVISFAKELEENSIKYYENLIQKYAQDKETFLAFIKENKKNIVSVQRVYCEGITDAIEGCFSFEGLDTDNYIFNQKVSADASYSNVLESAIEMEEKIQKFYLDSAEMSKSLLADIPRLFERIAQKRDNRKIQLESIYNKSRINYEVIYDRED